jgi:hypothetical protein
LCRVLHGSYFRKQIADEEAPEETVAITSDFTHIENVLFIE